MSWSEYLDFTEQQRPDGRWLADSCRRTVRTIGGSQLALDATQVSVQQRDGSARRKADVTGRGSPPSGLTSQRVDLSGTPRQVRQNPTRGHCWGGGWSLVARDEGVPVEFSVRAVSCSVKDSALKRPSCLVQEVELSLGDYAASKAVASAMVQSDICVLGLEATDPSVHRVIGEDRRV